LFGQLGFSYIGLIFLLMLFIPNIIWSRYQPVGYDSGIENKILLVLERIGQISSAAIILIFNDFNINSFSIWTSWLILSFLLMILYEIAWFRYFKSERKLENFYGDLFKIPLPLATLPVAAFLLMGIYGNVIWLVLSSIVLGIGHIGIHIQHSKSIKQDNK